MQLTFAALVAVVTALTAAAPMPIAEVVPELEARASCDGVKCAIALGPSGATCLGAVVAIGTNPVADFACLATALNSVVNVPTACVPCADQFGITKDVNSTISTVENKVKEAVHKLF